jgi:hypothetical protein
MSTKKLPPWKKSPLELKVEDVCEAEAFENPENENSIIVEYSDKNMVVKEEIWSKKIFEDFPYNIEEKRYFGIVTYWKKISEGTFIRRTEAWPIEKYWNPKLLED